MILIGQHMQVSAYHARLFSTSPNSYGTSCTLQAESMPLHGTVGQLLNRLIAAGVGQRPVIFVTHRLALLHGSIVFCNMHRQAAAGTSRHSKCSQASPVFVIHMLGERTRSLFEM